MEGNLSFLPNFRQFLIGQPERGILHNYKGTDSIFAAYLPLLILKRRQWVPERLDELPKNHN